MNLKMASCSLALALGALPVAAQTQTHKTAAKVAEVAPSVQPESSSGQLSETQWLRQRVEKLEAALASAEKCAKKDSSAKSGAAMKPDTKAGMGGSGMPMEPMEPMDDDKMDPGPMKPPADPPVAPMPHM